MKKQIHLTCTLLLCLLCTQLLKAQIRDAVINGKTSPELSYVILQTPQLGVIVVDTIPLAVDKTFKYHIKIKTAGIAYLIYGNNNTLSLWIKPGDALTINLQNKTPEFKGATAVYAKYYMSDENFFDKIYHNEYEKRNPHFDEEHNQFTDQYFKITDSMSIDRINFLKRYFKNTMNKDAQAFVKQQYLSFVYQSLHYKLMFNGTDIAKFKFYQDKYKIKRSDYYTFSDKVEFKNINLLSNNYYCRFVFELTGEIARKRIKDSGMKFNTDAYIDSSMHIIDELTEGAATNIYLKAIFFNNYIEDIKRSRRTERADKVYAVLASLSSTHANNNLTIVKNKLDKLILDTKFNKGNKAPDFILTDVQGRIYALNDFKGKRIYLDIGASWCGPCIATIPAWNKLVAANKDNENVVFISLSIDDKEEGWKTFLKKHTIQGLHLYAGEGGFSGKFAHSYNMSSIPKNILIDEEGKIIAYNSSLDSKEISAFLQKK